jgi:RNA polymerase sigma-70 factor, ECF subfamily
VAETFLVAWRRLDEMPSDGLPWLYGVARRVLANQRRTADRGAALEERVASAAPPAPSRDPGESAGDAEILRLALGRLPEPSREALMLVAWHGLSGARAARAAGCSRAAFAVRLHRARARLAAELAALEPQPIAGVESLEVTP